jgi:CRISPR-associated protein (TIGR03986 family)
MQGEQRQNGFVNPYNFVRLWGKVPRSKPESHEYFVGNRGRIVCQITFKTPFFIPHPERRFQLPAKDHEITDDQLPCWVREKALEAWEALKERIRQVQRVEGYKGCEGHEMLALLRDEQEKPFIPGSSLKGAFRTVAEALSNSCLSQLEFEWELMQKPKDPEVSISKVKRYYSYRRVKIPPFVGRVKSLAEKDKLGEIEIAERFKVFFAQPAHVNPNPQILDLSNFKDGDIVLAQCEELRQTIHPRPSREIQIPVFAVRRLRHATRQAREQGEREGIIKITDVTEAKKSQRFITWSSNPQKVHFDYKVRLKYDRALREGIEKDETDHPRQDYIDLGRAGLRCKRHKLREGDVVYFTKQNDRVADMGPVELYRVLYTHSLDAILMNKHSDFLTCQDSNCLCPACRLFGWVAPEADKEESTTALKGFVHFSPARWVSESKPKTQWVTLQPLGQPKPSCWQFYLNCQNVGENAGYNDDNATIRGRKFYWHKPQVTAEKPQQGANVESIWDQRGGNGQPLADNQNKTVELLLPDNAVFEFTVEFENLSDADLGLLLLTLQPNLLGEDILNEAGFSPQLYHHFGMGKPLGLGSAEVKIVSLTLFKDCQRYRSLGESGEEEKQVPEFVRKFIAAFACYAVKEQKEFLQRSNRPVPSDNAEDVEWLRTFVSMPPISDLLIMLDWEKAQELPVQYPPGHSDANNKEYWEAFRWFAHRNQREFFQRPRHMLKTPKEITPKEIIEGGKQDGFPPRDLSQRGSS